MGIIYWYFCKWIKNSTWGGISNCLTIDYHVKRGLCAEPEIAIIDSQSSKNSSTCTENVSIDGDKLVKGRKCFYIVDLLGNLLTIFVVSANHYDGTTAAKLWDTLGLNYHFLDHVQTIFADATFWWHFHQFDEKSVWY